jgi:hypothetical protein
MAVSTRILRIYHRLDGRFETRNQSRTDSPLGVDTNLNHAIGTAVREANMLAKAIGCRVVIEVQNLNGTFKREQIVNPPAKMNKGKRPA